MENQKQALLEEIHQKRKDLNLPPLFKRKFQDSAVADKTVLSNKHQHVLRVMQWNLLAQALSQGLDNFILCPEEALRWDHRKLHILEEILSYDATIVCLEEVDYFKYTKDLLSKVNYDGCFFPKPDSPCLYSHVNNGPDGCAIFWKKDEVKLEIQRDIILKNDNGQHTKQVAILCKFSHLESNKEFWVAVTHLKSRLPYWKIRYEQGKYLEKVLSETVPDSSPLIVCGDFNAEPSEQVYKIFKSSQLGLGSAYCHLTDKLEEAPFTTWKVRGGPNGNDEIVHCIDYIWFTTEHLVPLSLLQLPSEEQIGETRLPSLTYPSDHVSLVVDFGF